MDSGALLQEIATYCRSVGLAESTFGRLAINDGKLVNRLRYGGRITTDTLERIRSFMAANPRNRHGDAADVVAMPAPAPFRNPPAPTPAAIPGAEKNFRFYDNRQKYLLFVNTCSEKWVIAQRVAMELGNVHPRPPAVRLFDAGVGAYVFSAAMAWLAAVRARMMVRNCPVTDELLSVMVRSSASSFCGRLSGSACGHRSTLLPSCWCPWRPD